MYHLHKIILSDINDINEMLKSNLTMSKPKKWPQTFLIIYIQMCYSEYMTLGVGQNSKLLHWEYGKTHQCGISNAGNDL